MIEPIYIQRPVRYGSCVFALTAYAELIGVKNIVEDFHVTLAYSTEAVDWDKPAFQMDPRQIMVNGGDPEGRRVENLGGAIVMGITSPEFTGRWAQFIMAGGSWNYPEYKPHITLGYDDTFNVSKVTAIHAPGIYFDGEQREWLNTEHGSGSSG